MKVGVHGESTREADLSDLVKHSHLFITDPVA